MKDRLDSYLENNYTFALAYSGGIDSSYLLYRAVQAGANVRPYYLKSQFQPTFEFNEAVQFVKDLGIELTVIESDVLGRPEISANGPMRCYHCKKNMFSRLVEVAAADGFKLVADGTNASDDSDDRPGMRALAELGIRSPLRDCGFTKADIRRLSRDAGIPFWNKPAYSCLATRVASGQPITDDVLRKISDAETFLFSEGFSDFRVRVNGASAVLQFTEDEIDEAFRRRKVIAERLSELFMPVSINLKCRERKE